MLSVVDKLKSQNNLDWKTPCYDNGTIVPRYLISLAISTIQRISKETNKENYIDNFNEYSNQFLKCSPNMGNLVKYLRREIWTYLHNQAQQQSY